jgi:hypothetical protein
MSLGQMSVDNVTSIPLPIVSGDATLPLTSALLFAELSCKKKCNKLNLNYAVLPYLNMIFVLMCIQALFDLKMAEIHICV